jgi:hypothetical protein
MTNKPLIVGLASVAAMAVVLWSMPAAADIGSAARSSVYQAHDKWPGAVRQASTCPNPDDIGPPDGDNDCDDRVRSAPEPGTLALLALGLGGIGLGRIRRRARTRKEGSR